MNFPIALLLFAITLAPTAIAGPVSSFEDIQFWVGSETAANYAAMVIDWDDDSITNSTTDEALVWGYRWDGAATGADMLTAIVAADNRLYAKVNNLPPNATLLYGLGYDANRDGAFAINDGTTFDSDGFAMSGSTDGGESVDLADFYAEGWLTGFWNYGVEGPDSWSHSQFGMASTNLTSGDWNSWSFAQPIAFNVFPENLQAAMPPAILGDYNTDGIVNSADYTVWLDALGQTVVTNGTGADGDFSGIVDAADYTVWKQNFGNAANSLSVSAAFSTVFSNSATNIVPEPSSMALAIVFFLAFTRRARSVSRRSAVADAWSYSTRV